MINLNTFAEKWLEEKKQRIRNLLKIAFPDEALYREIILSLGYPKNKVQFLELALILPYKEIQKLKNQSLIEKALLYRAGFSQDASNFPDNFDLSLKLNKSYWVFSGIRPTNFPNKRIEGISYLLSQTIDKGICEYFKEQIIKNHTYMLDSKTSKKIVERIMSFEGIGISRKREMFFNIILPFFLIDESSKKYYNFLLKIFETHPPLDENSAIRDFKKTFFDDFKAGKIKISNTKDYFAIIKYIREKTE